MGNAIGLGRGDAANGVENDRGAIQIAEVVAQGAETEVERVNRVRLVAENMPGPEEEGEGGGKKRKRDGWAKYSEEEKADAIKKFNQGASTRDVAKSMRPGCSSGNVSRWRKQAEAEKGKREKKIAEVVAYLAATRPGQ